MSESVWTSKKPDRAGWWWYRLHAANEGQPLNLAIRDGELQTDTGSPVNVMRGDWSSSPIAEPIEPTPVIKVHPSAKTFTRLDCVATEGCKVATETEQKDGL
jgi:hypothetical protein